MKSRDLYPAASPRAPGHSPFAEGSVSDLMLEWSSGEETKLEVPELAAVCEGAKYIEIVNCFSQMKLTKNIQMCGIS